MFKRLKKYLVYVVGVISALVLLCEVAYAYVMSVPSNEHQGFYVEGLLGTTISGGGMSSEFNRGFNGFAWDFSAGYMFSTNWGVEGGFMRQKLDGTLTVANVFFERQNVDISTYLTVTYLAARFNIPMGQRFTFISKAGAMYAHRPSITAAANVGGLPSTTVISDNSGVSPFIGIGLSYAVCSNLALVFQWQGPYVSDSYGLLGVGLEYYFSG